jgi:hypothetical protein
LEVPNSAPRRAELIGQHWPTEGLGDVIEQSDETRAWPSDTTDALAVTTAHVR